MNLSEFKAWLAGKETEMSGPPDADQWAAIRAKLETVDALRFQDKPTVTIRGPSYVDPARPVPSWSGQVSTDTTMERGKQIMGSGL